MSLCLIDYSLYLFITILSIGGYGYIIFQRIILYENRNNDRKKLKIIGILVNEHRETRLFSLGWSRDIASLCKNLC
jgi:hypothetical protein